MSIHPTAIVSLKAELGKDVEVGAFAIVEDGVRIGDGSVLHPRSHLCSGSTLGKRCRIHMNAAVGHTPQDFSYKGEKITTVLGDDVTVRENATIHGTVGPAGTLVGDKCYLMVGSHVAHNCRLGKGVLLANGALLAGHVQVDDDAVISGNVVIHQFVRVGRLAILSGGSRFGMDVPPFLIGDGVNAVTTLNAVGLRRSRELSDEDRGEIKAAYKLLYRSGLEVKAAVEKMRAEFKGPAVKYWIDFLSAPSHRGFCRHRSGGRRGATPDE